MNRLTETLRKMAARARASFGEACELKRGVGEVEANQNYRSVVVADGGFAFAVRETLEPSENRKGP